MNLLGSLMPGIRQVRTPLAVGSLWIVLLGLVALQPWPFLRETFPTLSSLETAAHSLPLPYVIAALAFVAYVIGAMVSGLSTWGAKRVWQVADWVERHVRSGNGSLLRPWRFYLYTRDDSVAARSVLLDAVSVKYSQAGIPSLAAYAFPIESIDRQLESISLQLWNKAPDQYQESDRLRAESDFRVGISLPLIAIGLALGSLFVWWIPALFSAGALVLVLQARRLESERHVLLANAVYQGLASSTTLDTVARILLELKVPRAATLLHWYPATATALSRAGDPDGATQVVHEGVAELSQFIDFGKSTWKQQVDERMDEVRVIFTHNDDDESASLYEQLVAKAQARAEASIGTQAEGEDRDRMGRRGWYGRT